MKQKGTQGGGPRGMVAKVALCAVLFGCATWGCVPEQSVSNNVSSGDWSSMGAEASFDNYVGAESNSSGNKSSEDWGNMDTEASTDDYVDTHLGKSYTKEEVDEIMANTEVDNIPGPFRLELGDVSLIVPEGAYAQTVFPGEQLRPSLRGKRADVFFPEAECCLEIFTDALDVGWMTNYKGDFEEYRQELEDTSWFFYSADFEIDGRTGVFAARRDDDDSWDGNHSAEIVVPIEGKRAFYIAVCVDDGDYRRGVDTKQFFESDAVQELISSIELPD